MAVNTQRAYPIRADDILALREQKGMSLEDLANATDVHIKTLQGWLNGNPVYIRNIAVLAKALDANWTVENGIAVFATKANAESDSIEVIFRIPGTLKTVNNEKANQLIALIRQLASMTDNVVIHGMNEGNSVNITVRMSRNDVDKLITALTEGKLAGLDLLDVAIPSLLGGDKIHNPKQVDEKIENTTVELGTESTPSANVTNEPIVKLTPSHPDVTAKRREAENLVNVYAAGAVATVLASALIPGSASAILFGMETTMIALIGRIYKHKLTVASGIGGLGILGTASLIGQLAALEAAILLGPFAFGVKPVIALGIVKTMGALIIDYFEAQYIKHSGNNAESSGNEPPHKTESSGDKPPQEIPK